MPGASMNIREKLEVARQLARLRVDIIEAGFPIASDGDFEAVKAIASEVQGPRIAGLARCVDKDIDRAAEAVKPAATALASTFSSPPAPSIANTNSRWPRTKSSSAAWKA